MNIIENSWENPAGLSYEQAVRKYSDTVTRICVIRCGNAEDVKDCYQNVFLKLYLSKIEFESYEHIKAWLIQVAIHECSDLQRQFWKKIVVLSEDTSALEFFGVRNNAEDNDNTIGYVLSLPVKYRQVIYLYYYEEYKTNEIAKILGISEGTVKSQLVRGRKMLKNKLGGFENEEIFA